MPWEALYGGYIRSIGIISEVKVMVSEKSLRLQRRHPLGRQSTQNVWVEHTDQIGGVPSALFSPLIEMCLYKK
jgi:hypothetical protein